jgi:hypothetical protein
MALDKCIKAVIKAAGRELDEREKAAVQRHAAAIIRKAERAGETENLEALVRSEISLWADHEKANAIMEKRNSALIAKTDLSLFDYLDKVWGDDPVEGLRAIWAGSHSTRRGAKNGLAVTVGRERDRLPARYIEELKGADLLEHARSKKFDEQTTYAIMDIKAGKDEAAIIAQYGEIPFKLAKITQKHVEGSRLERNSVGGRTGFNPDVATPVQYDKYKIATAAGMRKIDKAENLAAFKKDLDLDLDRAYDGELSGLSVEKLDERLNKLFEDLSNGLHLNWIDQKKGNIVKGFANIAKRKAYRRELIFKTKEAEYKFHSKYRQGDSLYESTIASLYSDGRDLGLMKRAGPTPEASMKRLADRMANKLRNTGRGDEAKKLLAMHEKQMKEVWPVLTNQIGTSVNESFARVSGALRFIQRTAKLGKAALTSVTDIGRRAGIANAYGERSGSRYLSETFRGISDIVNTLGPDKRKSASEYGILLQGTHLPTGNFYSEMGLGNFSKWENNFMQYSGLMGWTNKTRSGSLLSSGNKFALYKTDKIASLPEGIQSQLHDYDISGTEWDLLRSTNMSKFDDGTEILDALNLRELPLENFDVLPEVKSRINAIRSGASKGGENAINIARERGRAEIERKYGDMLFDQANIASGVPDIVTQGMLMQGTKPGTTTGEGLRHFMMFKSYTAMYMRRHLGRILHGYHPDRVGNAQAMYRMFTNPGKGQLSALSYEIAGSVFWGLIADQLHDMASGIVPQIPTNSSEATNMFEKALWRSGAFGLYGDFLFAETTAQTSGGTQLFRVLAGPSFGSAGDFLDVYLRIREGKGERAASSFFRAVWNNVPYHNLFYTKAALDYLIFMNMNEFMDPGYLKRTERRLKKNSNQEYMLPPSEVLR